MNLEAERAALLRCILEQPEDDTARLVFADWLQENGEADRAEFIRLQIELARDFGRLGDVRYTFLQDRCRALLDYAHQQVNGELPNYVLWFGGSYSVEADFEPTWRRGFLSSVTCTISRWLIAADTILALHPLEAVRLRTLPTAYVPDFNALRQWKKPLEWGGDLCDSVCEEWPRIAFKFPHEDSPREPLQKKESRR